MVQRQMWVHRGGAQIHRREVGQNPEGIRQIQAFIEAGAGMNMTAQGAPKHIVIPKDVACAGYLRMRRHLPGFPVVIFTLKPEVGLNVLDDPSTMRGLMVQLPLNDPWNIFRVAAHRPILQLQRAAGSGPPVPVGRNDGMMAVYMPDATKVVGPLRRGTLMFRRLRRAMGRLRSLKPGLDEGARDDGVVTLQVLAAAKVVRSRKGTVRLQ
jgi:hypothetical protein